MKKLIPFFLLVFIHSVFSIYTTPGTGRSWNLDSLVSYSGGHITFVSGSYRINDTLTISSSDTIRVNLNTSIKLGFLSLVNISGTLIINPPSQVLVTPIDTNQKYIGFYFQQYSDASVLKKSVFEYGNAIKIFNSNILIDSCTIRYFTLGNNFSSGAISISACSPVISNCNIYGNLRSAILSAANGNASPTIINNTIYGNNTENAGAWTQVNLGTANSNPLIIRNNIIRGLYNQAGGISIANLVAGSIPNCIIENNIIKNNRYGIAVAGNNINALINNNIIDSNNTLPNPLLGGSGINLNGNSTQVCIIKRNKIRWNLWGITIQTSAKPDLGNLNNSDTSDNGFNYIYGNFHNDSTIDLYNNTADSIMAQNNFWGTGNLDTIEKHIVHKPDNPALGFVNYLPIYLPAGIEPISTKIPEEFNLFQNYPNPFNPSTKIKFNIPGAQLPHIKGAGGMYTKLIIFDILGREVATLVNQNLRPGTYEVEWAASDYASGVYFYKLEISDFSRTKKMLLLK